MKARAYVGLGANLGNPWAQVQRALIELAAWGPLRASSLYRTEPLGDPGQPWYVNAVAELETDLTPQALLERLQWLERRFGRAACEARWAPRLLDLDLLLYGTQVLTGPGLRVPHPGFHRRRFVLEPLAELAPELRDPRTGKSVLELLRGLDDRLRVEKSSLDQPGQVILDPGPPTDDISSLEVQRR